MVLERNYSKDILFGVAVGDALGVPVEFQGRETLKSKPVTDMIGGGFHEQLPGTWSDDSSLTFCLAEALLYDFSLQRIAANFVDWLYRDYWTARYEVFDVGNATREAINRVSGGIRPDLAGGFFVSDNGNGSLMRILPLLQYIKNKTINERYEITKLVSSITHGHIRSVIACFYYLEFARKLLLGTDKFTAYAETQIEVGDYLNSTSIAIDEIKLFDRLLKANIYDLQADEIQSTGYVLSTLEASTWCLLTSYTYSESVLKAVNLGRDTDTTGAVTGGLAGILYGIETIPEHWLLQIARYKDIDDLSNKLHVKYL